MTINMNELKNNIATSVKAVDNYFLKEHADNLDFGHCGYALVILVFGRKRKLKEQAIEAGLISENRTFDVGNKKGFVVELPANTVPTQFMGHFENRAKAAKAEIEEAFKGTGVDVVYHSWVD